MAADRRSLLEKESVMHITSFILIFIGIIGMMKPELFIMEGSGGGRWVFIVIFLLGATKIWPITKMFERNNNSD